MTDHDLVRRLPSTSEHWQSPAFREELAEWITSEVGSPSSLEPVKVRSWASVWRAETPGGVFFAKQNCAAQAFEAALLLELSKLVPDRVPPVAAVDLDRGLLLTPDQGPVFAEVVGEDLDAWCRVVSAGAELQREVAPYADRLAAAGLTTIAPADVVPYVERRLDEFATVPDGDIRAMSAEQQAALREHLTVVAGWAEQVASLRLPTTLVHNDLHGNNVFEVDGRMRFFDFGDALLMEPLAALLIPINVLAHRLEAPPDDPRLQRVADAGLEVWSDLVPIDDLRTALPVALQLARLGRTESWIRCLPSMNDTELADWGDSAAYWLASLLLDPPAGHLPG